ncbi:hypothetical protein [Photobacterium sp. GB-36]|uniref:hypothetical protein n=1 Tax=Photobacterium sp. GB-36 TaxID=2022108 RepID=UPI001E373433|nr:hypothetical protein [Photobacterium sp. GB-36]
MEIKMSCAIKINNGSNCSIINVGIVGFSVGIDAENSDNLLLQGVNFEKCDIGLRGKKLRYLKAQNCTHTRNETPFNSSLKECYQYYFSYTLLYLNIFNYSPYE